MTRRVEPSARVGRRVRLATVVLLLLSLTGCGRVMAHGGQTAKEPAAVTPPPPLHPSDLLPPDLDLVVRLDLRRMRTSLGDRSANELIAESIRQSATQGLLGRALEQASVVWLGIRVADRNHGDRVIAVEFGDESALNPDPNRWRRHVVTADHLARWERIQPVGRADFERVYELGRRGVVFVTPVERDAVARLTSGADADRGQPEARGLVSADYRPSQRRSSLDTRYPSLAKIMRGVRRVRAHVEFDGDMVQLRGRATCGNAVQADKVLRFIEAIRDGLKASPRYGDTLADLTMVRTEEQIRLEWKVPRRLVWALMRGPVPDAPSAEVFPPPPTSSSDQ